MCLLSQAFTVFIRFGGLLLQKKARHKRRKEPKMETWQKVASGVVVAAVIIVVGYFVYTRLIRPAPTA